MRDGEQHGDHWHRILNAPLYGLLNQSRPHWKEREPKVVLQEEWQ